jgi:hypothetical protein
MKSFLLSIGLLGSITFVKAQEWAEMMHRPNANFYEVQQKFNEYWQGKDHTEKGKGWKAFKRWENFVEPRVYPSGDLSQLSLTAINYEQWLEEYNSQNNGSKFSSSQIQASTTWTAMGPFGALSGSAGGQLNKSGRLNFVTINPTNTVNLYVGAPAGGLWISNNGGTSWTTNTDNLTVTGCSDLAIDPTNTLVMYLATGDGDAGDTRSTGVLKSTDGGNTWASTGLTNAVTNNFLIRRLIINPNNPQVLLAATNGGIYRTANGGTNWSQVATGNIYDLEFKPGDPNTVYAAGTNFRISTNGGTTFSVITNGIPNTTAINRMAIAVTPNNPAAVYVVASNASNNGFYGIYRSTASGTLFSQMTTTLNLLGWNSNGADQGGQGWYDLAIAASPTNSNEVVVGGVNIWRTTDGAASWSLYGHWTGSGAPFIHADIHDLEYAPNGTLFSANDGTIYRRTPGATSWTEICGQMNISQIYKIGTSSLAANKWISGHQDNGTNIYTGTSYNASIGGDGMDCFIDRTNDNNMFGETYNGSFRKSTNAGGSWASCVTGLSGTAPWVTIWKQDPITATTLYAGRQQMFKSLNSAGSWSVMGSLPNTTGTINEFAVAPSNPLVIYVLKNAGIYRTADGGLTWATITGTIPVSSANPQFVAIDPTDPNNAWVVCSGYSNGNKIWVTTNGGSSWTNISAGLPNIPANCVVYQPGTSDRIYVGMDVGVYTRDNSSTGWTLYNTGLPNTPVSDMEISPADPTKLIAATYGRGVWKVDLIASNVPPVSAFTHSGTICTGIAKTFSDASTNSPTSWSWSVSPTIGATITTATSQNPNITFANTGTYTVSLVASNSSGTGSLYSQTVAVIASPSVVISNSVQSICAGTSATFNASGASTYSWNTGVTTSSLSVSPSITTIYTVTGTSNGCSTQRSATLTIKPNPTVTVNSATICTGNSATLSASGATSYSWNTGAITSSISVNPSTNTIYTVTGTTNGCTNIKTATVTVTSPPVVTVNSATICSGSSANLTASGASTYSWNTGGTGSSINVSPNSTTVYSVTGFNGSCSSTVKTATVTVNSSPTVTVNSATICSGATATLTASGANTYSWNNGSSGSMINVSPTATIIYTVTGYSGSCSNAKTSTVTVNQNPAVTITANSTVICSGSTLSLSASGASTYTWYPGNTTGSTLNTTPPNGTQIYTVTGASAVGCKTNQTITIMVTTCTGIEGNATNFSFSIYPNPASDIVTIQLIDNGDVECSVIMTDAIGKIISSHKRTFTASNSTLSIRTTEIANGIYFLTISTQDGSSKTIKLIKE